VVSPFCRALFSRRLTAKVLRPQLLLASRDDRRKARHGQQRQLRSRP
jgi:hypothetical protein